MVPRSGDHVEFRELHDCEWVTIVSLAPHYAPSGTHVANSPHVIVDIWSVGCVLAELLGGRPIFKGKDYIDQLNIVLHFLGTPSDKTLRRVGSPRVSSPLLHIRPRHVLTDSRQKAQDYIRSLPYKPGVPFAQLYPSANPLALDLLSKLLAFDPHERISCQDALVHPYLSVWHEPADEPECREKFDFGFEREETIEGMRQLIVEEVESFRRMVSRDRFFRSATSVSRRTHQTSRDDPCSPRLIARFDHLCRPSPLLLSNHSRLLFTLIRTLRMRLNRLRSTTTHTCRTLRPFRLVKRSSRRRAPRKITGSEYSVARETTTRHSEVVSVRRRFPRTNSSVSSGSDGTEGTREGIKGSVRIRVRKSGDSSLDC